VAEKEKQGLARAEELYQNRTSRVQELKAEGKKVMGYLCILPTLEVLTALDIVPYRIFGDMKEPITKGDSCLPTVVCPFLRSCLDLGLKGKYGFLDGVVMSHICDVGEKTAHIWNMYLDPSFFFFIDTPHTVHRAAQKRHQEQLQDLVKSLEEFAGRKLTPEALKEAVAVHNRQRALVRQLYDMRKPDPPLISGVETLQVMKALMGIPVAEGNVLLEEVLAEVSGRDDGPKRKPARLMLWGTVLDDIALVGMIEELQANVVMDDTCVGSRFFFPDVKLTADPLEGLAYRYLVEMKCPRTFREASFGETKWDYKADIDSRFSYLGGYAKDWNVNGVVLQSLRYCDTHGYEVPQVGDYLDGIGLPHIYLEHDYSQAALAPLRTRVQAFLEIID